MFQKQNKGFQMGRGGEGWREEEKNLGEMKTKLRTQISKK